MTPEIKAEIIFLLKIGRPVKEISLKLELPEGTIRRIGYEQKIIKLDRKPNGPNNRELDEYEASSFMGNYFTEAIATLGNRYEERNGCMWLRGRPASVGEIMLAANEIRVFRGESQLGKRDDWKIVVACESEV